MSYPASGNGSCKKTQNDCQSLWHNTAIDVGIIQTKLSVSNKQTAQAILDAREIYPDSSLADLYDPLTMPPELRKAHQKNDAAVMQAYGFSVKDTTEADCVAALMKMYQELTKC